MATLSDLHPRKRRETVAVALEGTLRRLSAPAPTYDLVQDIAFSLGTRETKLIARVLVDLAPLHPCAQRAGVPFERFGRTMQRWEWKPLTAKLKTPTEVEARRARQRAAEDDDQWTIQPEDI